MDDNKDSDTSQHELDENKNSSSLNIGTSNSNVNDSLNLINSSEKNISGLESQVFSDDTLISEAHSSSKKNALIDSGFHCENLEKIVPDLVNNSLCEPVFKELDNGIREAKKSLNSSNISFHSYHDDSFNTCDDVSFSTPTNTTQIALLFERLTLGSEGNESPLKSSASQENLVPSAVSKNESPLPLESSALPEKLVSSAISKNEPQLPLESSALSKNLVLSVTSETEPPLPLDSSTLPENVVSSSISKNDPPMPLESSAVSENLVSSAISENEPPLPSESSALTINLISSAISETEPRSETSEIEPMPIDTLSMVENKQTNLLNVSVKSTGSKTENPDNSVSPDKSLHQSSLPCSSNVSKIENHVSHDETFKVETPGNITVNSSDGDSFKIPGSDAAFSETSSGDVFKHPLPVPELSNELNPQNITDDNMFSVEAGDNQDGEEFQDAVQFFKDPSSFQALENIETSQLPGGSMPRDSLYMNFDPLYKKVIQPTNVASVESTDRDNVFKKESLKEDLANVKRNQLTNKNARQSLGINLVSFDSPIKNNTVVISEKESIMNKTVKKEVFSSENVDNDSYLIDSKHAPDVFALESLGSTPLKSSKDISEKGEALSKESLNEGICNAENTQRLLNKIVPQESSGILLSIDSPIKSNFEKDDISSKVPVNEENSPDNIQNDQHLQNENASDTHIVPELLENLNVKSEKDCDDLNEEYAAEEILKENPKLVAKVLARASLSGNLLSFDSPIKSNSEIVQTPRKNEQKLYSEEELQQALKIYELTMQEAYLKKQRDLEVEASKQGSDTKYKLQRVTGLCNVLLETVIELSSVASEENVKIGELSTQVKKLESENQELQSNLKTSTEDLQSVEHTFSDFHKRYVQCKDMLKTYKDNEDQLKTHAENLNKKLEEQEQMYATLQVKMGEMVDKANAEVATAKKGGDVQVAVLKAQLKKAELKVSSLENELKQTKIENDKLSNICDDLMAKVSEA